MSEWSDFLVAAGRSFFSQSHTHRIFVERIMLEIPRGGKIVEAGCGLAYLSNLLADIGYNVTAGDIDEEVLLSAKSRIQMFNHQVDFVKLNLMERSKSLEKKYFDAIVHSGVMEHFSDEAIIHSFSEQKYVAKSLIFKIPNSRTKKSLEHFGDERFLPNRDWVKLLRDGGYNEIKVMGGESLPTWSYILPSIVHLYPKHNQSKSRMKLLNAISRWRKHFSRHTIFVCR